ncbi:MAG: Fic family protein [Bacteriovoracaceae bacterium]|nr:Fic family protein [Bacteriovoracaceae bacterium]
MTKKDSFQFLSSDIWLKYTQQRYTPVDHIKYRLDNLGLKKQDWPKLQMDIQNYRKVGAIPLFLSTIDKKFWYFPADCILKKVNEIESLGKGLFYKIKSTKTFQDEFLANAAMEEAITSAIYEGANSSRSKARELIANDLIPKNIDEWMLLNNYKAMKWIKSNSQLNLTSDLVTKIHKIVTNNTLEGDDANFYGKYRNDTVYVGNHQGIDHKQIEAAINEAIELTTNNKRYLHGLIKGIFLHYFLAYIHPFFDGNGRTGRTLFYFKAIKNDLKFIELLSISAHLKEHGKQYEKSFGLVTKYDLDLTYFIDFCLDSLLAALIKVRQKVDFLISIGNLKKSYQLRPKQISLLQKMALNKHRAVSINEFATSINQSREVARRELKDLSTKGLLKEIKRGKKFVYFIQSKKLKEIVSSTLVP